ncbi:hypothetical protein [Oceanobacillus sojae]|uniref:hypothetical protein n=1 Tax=Oceanobacillus sojae TaxID=582851 RepID=UPI0021A5D885|nr:hypothetical protein [Oceanobacillus sojae]MCT1901291.1 hypothetical protein [Oceanobacillus sojae]
MNIKLGILGEKNIVQRVQEITKQFPSIEALPFVFSESGDALAQAEGAVMCDALLFTDYCSYHEAVKQKHKQMMFYIDYDEYSILLSILYKGKLSRKKCLSIDYPEDIKLMDFTHDTVLSGYELFSINYNKQDIENIQKWIDFHKELFSRQKTDLILTSRKDVYTRLLQEGLPVYFIEIAEKCIVQALEKVTQILEIESYSTNLVMTGILSLKESLPIHLHHQVHTEIRRYLSDFCKKNDAMLLPTKDSHYFIIGTNKLIKVIKENYRAFPLMDDVEKIAGSPIALAFGLGLNPLSSQKHAYLALEACQSDKGSLSYLINECQEKMGPIGQRKNIDTNKLFYALVHQARLNNELSYLFIQFIVERNNEPFSSNDIADFYQVTKRSAERTVKKLLSGEIIQISGKESPYTKGRPRKLFVLNQ